MTGDEMNLLEIFDNHPNFKQYLIDNKIERIEDLTYSDILLGARDKELSKVVSIYFKLRRSLDKFNINNSKIDSVFEDRKTIDKTRITKLKDIVSIWSNHNEESYSIGLKSIVSLLISYLSYNSVNKENEKNLDDYLINNGININKKIKSYLRKIIKFDFDKIIIYNTFIKCKNINKQKVSFEDYRKLISINNKDCFLNSFVSVKAYNYLEKKGIKTFEEIYNYLNEDDYNKLYIYLINTIPLLKETNNKNIPCDYVVEDFIAKNGLLNELVITNMKIKGMKDSEIMMCKNVSYKGVLKAYYNILNHMRSFFDSYNGRYFIYYLLSIEDGYISVDTLKRVLPKYYLLLIDVISKDLIYKVYYNKEYNIITSRITNFRLIDNVELRKNLSDMEIFEKYEYNIDEDEYKHLYEDVLLYLKNKGLNLPLDIIYKRIGLVYSKIGRVYSRGYVSSEYKVLKVYENYFNTGIPLKEISTFQDKYNSWFSDNNDIVSKNTHYFVKNKEKYVLKKSILMKYNKIFFDEDTMIIFRVCESMKSIFNVNDVSTEVNMNVDYVRKIISKSWLYYQLSFNTFIKSDDLFIDNNLMTLFIKLKDEKENRIYDEVERKFKGFLKGYGIKNKVYLRRIVKRVVSKKVKILALN